MTDIANDVDGDPEFEPSKTQLKKDAHALQQLGEQLTHLSEAKLALLPLTNELRLAVADARKMKPGSARKRQIQYLGKLIRKDDSDALQAAVDNLQVQQKASHQTGQLAEFWRQRLLENDQALSEFIDQYPNADRQQLRQLLRNSHKALAKNSEDKTATRKLQQWLSNFLTSS